MYGFIPSDESVNALYAAMIQDKKKETIEDRFSKELTFKIVNEVIENNLKVDFFNLKSRNAKRNVGDARHITWKLIKEFSDMSKKEIGRRYGGRDHSSVISGIAKVEALIETDKIFADRYFVCRHEVYVALKANQENNNGKPVENKV